MTLWIKQKEASWCNLKENRICTSSKYTYTWPDSSSKHNEWPDYANPCSIFVTYSYENVIQNTSEKVPVLKHTTHTHKLGNLKKNLKMFYLLWWHFSVVKILHSPLFFFLFFFYFCFCFYFFIFFKNGPKHIIQWKGCMLDLQTALLPTRSEGAPPPFFFDWLITADITFSIIYKLLSDYT